MATESKGAWALAKVTAAADATGLVEFDRGESKNRNVVKRRLCQLQQLRGPAIRYDKLAVEYRAAVILNTVIVIDAVSRDGADALEVAHQHAHHAREPLRH